MKSGLYACAGDSATASAAAWANRFDEPITNESNVYFGLIPTTSGRVVGSTGSAWTAAGPGDGTAAASGGSAWSTSSRTLSPCPPASRTAARIRSRKCPSIHSRVKSFGTVITNPSPSSCDPPTSPNHVRYVLSLSAPRNRAATSFQRLSAVSSICRSTLPRGSPTRPVRSASIAASSRPLNEDFSAGPAGTKRPVCRTFFASTRLSTAVETVCRAAPFAGLSTGFAVPGDCGQPTSQRVRLYWPAAGGSRLLFLLFGLTGETDLSAERAQAEAQARVPCAHGDARRPRDPEAAPREGPRAPVGLSP